MTPFLQDLIKLPNLISMLRIMLLPLLFYFTYNRMELWFLATLLFSCFTDVVDGYLARRLNQVTDLGSHLDSLGDFSIYLTVTVCAWIMWPETVMAELSYVLLIILSFTLPALVALIKFSGFSSYHTLSVKLAVMFTVFGYVLLFSGLNPWLFRMASILCVYAALEEIAISLVLKKERIDVRSLWHALAYKKHKQA